MNYVKNIIIASIDSILHNNEGTIKTQNDLKEKLCELSFDWYEKGILKGERKAQEHVNRVKRITCEMNTCAEEGDSESAFWLQMYLYRVIDKKKASTENKEVFAEIIMDEV